MRHRSFESKEPRDETSCASRTVTPSAIREDMIVTLRFDRRYIAALVVALALAGVIAVFVGGSPTDIDSAHAAACKSPNPSCLWGYRTAAVDVAHIVPGAASGTPVEPDDGETWNITAYWNTWFPICHEQSETASVTVSWTGSNWVISGKTTTAHIIDINVCDTNDFRDSQDTHSYGYRLTAKVVDPVSPNHNLRQVVFTTTSVDDGQELDTSTCVLGTSVSPTSQSFSATDSSPWGCGYSCSNVGTSVQITYE